MRIEIETLAWKYYNNIVKNTSLMISIYLVSVQRTSEYILSTSLPFFLIMSICFVQPSPSPQLATPWCVLLWLSSMSLHLHFIKASDLIFITQLHVNRELKVKVQARSWPPLVAWMVWTGPTLRCHGAEWWSLRKTDTEQGYQTPRSSREGNGPSLKLVLLHRIEWQRN